ncbi:DPH4 homolog [Microplitis demolitor]|uniref:DPH4 homolog n=1 Tax=Microplitis demolitor TaxID=69319 RepID=UPI0004CD08A7|nr:DPH4 homolog [Microplitis demolitor]
MSIANNGYRYYEVLGCNKDSTYDELKRAYYKLALIYHPDKAKSKKNNDNVNDTGGNLNNKKFTEIEEAWRVLSDKNLKIKYDAECRQAELEIDNLLIYDRINLKSMTVEDDVLSYPCRCGSNYLINSDEFTESIYIPCSECTFCIYLEK